jgi:DNA mismatch repair protein MutS2
MEVGGEWTTLLISGPNAGGKSVAMKSIGLFVLMAQSGLHIPASDGTALRLFRSCFVDIGDEQSIENDLSTFSSHLASLKAIAEQADGESLVLIDEIGAGTDPSEGGAIAGALLEELTRRRALTIATTHQGALKVFAHETEGVANGAMEFDLKTLTPTYRFRAGVPGSSYALEMAARLGFSPALMERSRQRLGQQNTRLDSLIIELESATQKARLELEAAREEKLRLEALALEYREKLARLTGEAKDLKRKAIEDAARIVEGANAVIEKSIREIRETKAERETVRRVRGDVSRMTREIDAGRREIMREVPVEARGNIVEGSSVTVAGGSDVGEVVAVSADGKSATVVFGALRMRVSLENLLPARKRPAPASRTPGNQGMEKPATVRQDLDIRGMTGDEALPLIDKFIDDAILSGLNRVDVIHGKGTGALRKKVTDFLASHARVKGYHPGEWNEGGMGVTVIELSEN